MITIQKGQAPKFAVYRGYFEDQPLNQAMEALENVLEDMGYKERAEEHRRERLKRIKKQYERYEVD